MTLLFQQSARNQLEHAEFVRTYAVDPATLKIQNRRAKPNPKQTRQAFFHIARITPSAPSGVLSPLGGLVWRTPLVGLEAAEIGTHRNLVRSVVGTDNHIGLRPLLSLLVCASQTGRIGPAAHARGFADPHNGAP